MALNIFGNKTPDQLAKQLLQAYPNVDPNLILRQAQAEQDKQQQPNPWAAMPPEATAALQAKQGQGPSQNWLSMLQGMPQMPLPQVQPVQLFNPGGGSGPGGGAPTQPVPYPQTAVPQAPRRSFGQMLASLGR